MHGLVYSVLRRLSRPALLQLGVYGLVDSYILKHTSPCPVAAGRALWAWRLLEAAAAVQGISIMQLCKAGARMDTGSGSGADDGDQPALKSGSGRHQSATADITTAAATDLEGNYTTASQSATGECFTIACAC